MSDDEHIARVLEEVTKTAVLHAKLDRAAPRTGWVPAPEPLDVMMRRLGGPETTWDIFRARSWILANTHLVLQCAVPKAHDTVEDDSDHDDDETMDDRSQE